MAVSGGDVDPWLEQPHKLRPTAPTSARGRRYHHVGAALIDGRPAVVLDGVEVAKAEDGAEAPRQLVHRAQAGVGVERRRRQRERAVACHGLLRWTSHAWLRLVLANGLPSGPRRRRRPARGHGGVQGLTQAPRAWPWSPGIKYWRGAAAAARMGGAAGWKAELSGSAAGACAPSCCTRRCLSHSPPMAVEPGVALRLDGASLLFGTLHVPLAPHGAQGSVGRRRRRARHCRCCQRR